MSTYKQIITPSLYEDIRNSLGSNISDDNVEKYLQLTLEVIKEDRESLTRDEFKDIINFAVPFRSYFNSFATTGDCSFCKKFNVLVEMIKNNHPVPDVIKEEVAKFQHEQDKGFLDLLLGEYEDDEEYLTQLYLEQERLFQEKYPGKSFASKEDFIKTLSKIKPFAY